MEALARKTPEDFDKAAACLCGDGWAAQAPPDEAGGGRTILLGHRFANALGATSRLEIPALKIVSRAADMVEKIWVARAATQATEGCAHWIADHQLHTGALLR